MEQWDENVRRHILDYKKSMEYTNRKLCKLTGIPESAMGRYLNGESHIPVTVVLKLASVMDVSVQYLLGLTDDPSPSLPNDIRRLVECYSAASDDDKAEIDSIISKYV